MVNKTVWSPETDILDHRDKQQKHRTTGNEKQSERSVASPLHVIVVRCTCTYTKAKCLPAGVWRPLARAFNEQRVQHHYYCHEEKVKGHD